MGREASLTRGGALVLGALAAIALHVADDSFFQPQPGTSAADHLAGGLVPIVVLALAAAAWPRLRDGARGALALLFGAFGLVGGIEAAYYARDVGPSGDDYTGFLSLAAGAALVGAGAVFLWRSRRGGGIARRYARRGLVAVGALVAAYVVLMPIFLAYVVTHTARAVVPPARLGAPHEEVSFTTSDGLRLKGWYVPSRNGAAIIAFPGRKGPQPHARMLARHGYGVLLFDRRGEGESEGDPNIFGWQGERDLHAAVAFLRGRGVDPARIGGVGLSVGGEMMLEAAAESDGLRAVVSEGAGARSIREVLLTDGGSKWLQVPSTVVVTFATAVFTSNTPPANLRDLAARIPPTPVFFVYAEHGQGGEELNPTYYAAAGAPKAIWKIPGATHTHGIDVRPAEYERRVVGFFDRALLHP